MTSFLKSRNIRIFDYPRFAQKLRDDIRINAEAIAKEHGIEIQFIQKTQRTLYYSTTLLLNN
jgi:hypothetical protein